MRFLLLCIHIIVARKGPDCQGNISIRSNSKVQYEEVLIQCASDHCGAACEALEEVLLIQDTMELNLESHRRRLTGLEGLGTIGNGSDVIFLPSDDNGEGAGRGAGGGADSSIMERERGEDGKYRTKEKHEGKTLPINDTPRSRMCGLSRSGSTERQYRGASGGLNGCYSSQAVESPEGAAKIIGYYQKRWIIEEVFRTMKREGVRYEEAELENGKALRKLLVMAIIAAVQILQLRQGGKHCQQVKKGERHCSKKNNGRPHEKPFSTLLPLASTPLRGFSATPTPCINIRKGSDLRGVFA